MSWREDMIERHKADIEWMRESIKLMEAGREEIGQVSASGEITNLNEGVIAHYLHTIKMLESVIATLEAKDY